MIPFDTDMLPVSLNRTGSYGDSFIYSEEQY